MNEFELALSHLLPCTDEIICLGDFNINFWNSDNVATATLKSILEAAGLVQIISSPTRIAAGSETLIDLMIVSNSEMVVNSGTKNVHISDHELICIWQYSY